MEPAYHIPLSKDEFALLGELTAIIGLVDEEMTVLVQELLGVERGAANVVMGSTKISDNTAIWASIIAENTSDEDLLWLVKHADIEVQKVSEGRNDFVHAIFEMKEGPFDSSVFDPAVFHVSETVARRVRRVNERPVCDLKDVRDRAARLSCLVAHISHLVRNEPSPWQDKLDPAPPPRPDKDATHKATGRRRRRKPSRA
jgi:hypothetical protein